MIGKLQNLLHFDQWRSSNSSQFIKYLAKFKNCNVRNSNIFEWQVEPNEFRLLFNKSNKNKWIASPQYTVYMNATDNNNDNDDDDFLVFHFEAQNKAKNNLFRVRIHLDSKPDNVAKINLGMGLFCAAANNFYNVSLHSLFETRLLRKSCKQKTFALKLQIQLFYVYDFSGKLIQTNQSQEPPRRHGANANSSKAIRYYD